MRLSGTTQSAAKRIQALIPQYRKPLGGLLIAEASAWPRCTRLPALRRLPDDLEVARDSCPALDRLKIIEMAVSFHESASRK
jgi:hypothetical protein